MSLTAR